MQSMLLQTKKLLNWNSYFTICAPVLYPNQTLNILEKALQNFPKLWLKIFFQLFLVCIQIPILTQMFLLILRESQGMFGISVASQKNIPLEKNLAILGKMEMLHEKVKPMIFFLLLTVYHTKMKIALLKKFEIL